MLELHKILWIIPGVVFIYLFNQRRPNNTISLSGWPYLSFLVVIAALTWLPAEFMIKTNILNIKTFFIDTLNLNIRASTLLVAVIWSFILFLLVQWERISQWVVDSQWISLVSQDNFYNKCIEWENEEVLLTLKNAKAYHGLLWMGPDNPNLKHESQTISIIPFKSGYRDKQTKKVIWNINYPEYKSESDVMDMEVIIPRSEIITFGRFNKRVFKYFNSEGTS